MLKESADSRKLGAASWAGEHLGVAIEVRVSKMVYKSLRAGVLCQAEIASPKPCPGLIAAEREFSRRTSAKPWQTIFDEVFGERYTVFGHGV